MHRGEQMERLKLFLIFVFFLMTVYPVVNAIEGEWTIDSVTKDPVTCKISEFNLVIRDNAYPIYFNLECLNNAQVGELMTALEVKSTVEDLRGKTFSVDDSSKSPILLLIIETGLDTRIKYWEEVKKELKQ